MICEPADCRHSTEIDIPATHAKYLRERDRPIETSNNNQSARSADW